MDEGDYEERRGRPRGRPRGRHRGRPRTQGRARAHKRNKIESDDEEEEERGPETEILTVTPFDKDCDISALEAPTFTTLDRGPPAPMLQLMWNHPVTLIGEKVLSPRIHSCDTCNKPILIYGRMIPCKHVFCLWCTKSEDRVCARCGDRVARVEQTGLGTVFMCTFSINDALCKRTYLSQRDLQAHIDHRHMKISGSTKDENKDDRISHRDPRGEPRLPEVRQPIRVDPRPDIRPAAAANDPRVGSKELFESREGFPGGGVQQFPRAFNPSQPPPTPHHTSAQSTVSHHIPVMTSSRTNLITVPIQDPPPEQQQQPQYQSNHPPPSYPPPPPPHVTHQQHASLSHPHPPPPPPHPFTSPPPLPHSQPPPPYSTAVTSSYSTPYSSAQQPPQYTYPPTGAPPQNPLASSPYSSTLPPVPVPPPTTYGNQYNTGQWNTPPPPQQQGPHPQGPHPSNHPIAHPPPGPPRHHHPPNAQTGPYYR